MRVFVIVVSLLIAGEARAYRNAQESPETLSDAYVRWMTSTPGVSVNPQGFDVSVDAVMRSTRRAASLWSEDPLDCSEFRWLVEENPAVGFVEDGLSSISASAGEWAELGLPADVVAVTSLVYVETPEGFEIVEFDTVLDTDNQRWSPEALRESELRLDTVIAHELGHGLGLLHPCGEPGLPNCEARDLMAPRYDAQAAPALSDSEADSMCDVYPSQPEVDEPPCPLCGRATFGESCAASADCISELCLTDRDGADSFCTIRCESTCGTGWSCEEVDALRVCVPQSADGCRTGATSRVELCVSAAFLLVVVSRRRRL
ncbi:MAG: hypothetical protein MUE69_12365 [Myxococcota bacterium]|jgi:hypothetical protein|nr:hypothetical protein [Myxococcota bacterium]